MKNLLRLFTTVPIRLRALLLKGRMERDLNEELQFHLDEEIAQLAETGVAPENVRRVTLLSLALERQKERCRELRPGQWLSSLRADVIFGWRQWTKRKVVTAAAVASLALSTGGCIAAFRLIDAMLLRPLPITDPSRLYYVHFDGFSFQGEPAVWDDVSSPALDAMQQAVQGQAELIAISPAQLTDVTYGSDQEMERVKRQFVSGSMFPSFGLQPALGRLLTEDDDRKSAARPYAVLSWSYWSSRFGRDPKAVGSHFRVGTTEYRIIGVAEQRFIGTEPGTIPDIFVPTMMNDPGAIRAPGNGWLRVFVRPNAGVAIEPVRVKMYAAYRAFQQQRARGWTSIPKNLLAGYPREKLVLKPAGSGLSQIRQDYQPALLALGALVAMVLLIACANVANLKMAETASRAHEMALRVSIGATRRRVMQMVIVESIMLALVSSGLGALFAQWAAPFVVDRISLPGNPVQLVLTPDWRVVSFGLSLSLIVVLLFAIAPALRASSIHPVGALKGGEIPRSRGRAMHLMIAVQVAFCFVVLFLSGLFARTFQRLSAQHLGFSGDRILLLETVTAQAQTAAAWEQMTDHLRSAPGVESAAMASWGLVSGQTENSLISVNGAPPSKDLGRFLFVSPGWLETMKIPLAAGRDLRPDDVTPRAAVVNRAFARAFFGGRNPVGESFAWPGTQGTPPFQVVGLAEDAAYKDVHDAMLPVAYVPMQIMNASGVVVPRAEGTFVVRTLAGNPMTESGALREEIHRTRPEFRVRNVTTQAELVRAQTVRERLLAMLAVFFAEVALLLATIGLYGVASYSVQLREREFGIRIAIGAQMGAIARLVTAHVMAMVAAGAGAGVLLGIASARYVGALLYGVKTSDPWMLLTPAVVLLATAMLAVLPAALRAVRVDPVTMLRAQ
jgi:predicted permease